MTKEFNLSEKIWHNHDGRLEKYSIGKEDVKEFIEKIKEWVKPECHIHINKYAGDELSK